MRQGNLARTFILITLGLVALLLACGGATTPDAQLTAVAATTAPAAGETSEPIPTSTPAPTKAPSAGGAVTRLRVAAAIEREGNDPTRVVPQFGFQNTPMYEGLTRMGLIGEYEPQLATWEVSADLRTWTWHLEKGVQWHRGFGEFTAQDLLHSIDKRIEDQSVSAFVRFYQALHDSDGVDVVDDHTVIYNLSAAKIDMWALESGDFYHSILSKAHFDAEGQEGIEDKPVGTGPYQYVERVLGAHVLFERVPYDHYQANPDFDEVQILRVPEHSIRLAMLLAGEADIVMLPRDLEPTAINAGMEVIEGTIPSVPVYTMFGGNYHPDGVIREGSKREGIREELPYSDIFHPVTEVPWVHRKVRQALNMAVNRDEILETLFRGQGDKMAVTFYHPSLPGWNQQWADNLEENYGYNPDRAKELLKEVEDEIGQPLDWSKTIYLLTIHPELPELADLGEAIVNYWQAIGAAVELEVKELSEWRTHYLSGTMGGVAWTDATLRFNDPRILEIIYYSKNNICCHFFERDVIDEIYDRLVPETDLAKRDQLLREAGNYIYDEYGTLPLFWFPATFTVNPEVVAAYPTPGNLPPRDFENVVAAK